MGLARVCKICKYNIQVYRLLMEVLFITLGSCHYIPLSCSVFANLPLGCCHQLGENYEKTSCASNSLELLGEADNEMGRDNLGPIREPSRKQRKEAKKTS